MGCGEIEGLSGVGLRVGGLVVADPERLDRAFWLLRWPGDEELPPVVIRIELVGAELRIGDEGREGEVYSYQNAQVALEAAREQLERAVAEEGATLFSEGCSAASPGA